MASKSFLPDTDQGLLEWSAQFKTQIVATPTAFGLVASQSSAYAALHDAYASALATATNGATRTRGTVAAKNTARTALKARAGDLSRVIQGTPTVTNQQKYDLRLNVRATPVPIPPPSSQPAVEVVSVMGRTVTLRFKSTQTIGKRSRPPGTIGLQIYSYVGAEAPTDPMAWHFEGTCGQLKAQVQFPASVPAGSQVWISASWVSPRLMTGPAANPVSTYLQFGNTVVTAPQQARTRKAA